MFTRFLQASAEEISSAASNSKEGSPVNDEVPPRILLMGLPKVGKTSIQKVVFEKMLPDETIRLSTSYAIDKDIVSEILQFEIWNIPGQITLDELDGPLVFGSPGAVVFVIDAQGEIPDAMQFFIKVVRFSHQINPDLKYEVFLHKMDGVSDSTRAEILHRIIRDQKNLFDDFDISDVTVRFHFTTIYDVTIYEGLSHVIQSLIPDIKTLVNLLTGFSTSAGLLKLYLFDVCTKLVIATDSFPDDSLLFHMCSDVLDIAVDVGSVFCLSNGYNGASAYDKESTCNIHFDDGRVLCLRAINRYLAFVCLVSEGHFKYEAILDHNLQSLATGICKLLQCYKWTKLDEGDKTRSTADESPDGYRIPVRACS